MGSIFGAIYGLIKAIPVLDSWFKALISFYLARQIEAHNSAFAEALAALIKNHDQSILERAMGSHNAGKPATDPTDVEEIPAGEFET